MSEPALPSQPKAPSTVTGVLLILLGLGMLIGVVVFLLFVLFEGSSSIGFFVLVLAAAVVALVLRAAQQRLPGVRVGVIATVVAVVVFLLLGFLIIAPGLFTNVGRSKQKRTMADLRSIATAIEAYATDHGQAYPKTNNFDELPKFLTPTYIRSLPSLDGWKQPIRYQQLTNPDSTESYFLGSAGEDGRWERKRLSDYTTQATTRYDNDIIFSNGEFVQYPDGVQTR